MNVLYISGREISYVRNRVISNALSDLYEIEIIFNNSNSHLVRIISNYISIIKMKKKFDFTFIGFYGNPYFLLTKKFLPNIIFDSFVSTFDTLCYDREIFSPNSLFGKLTYFLDKYCLENSSHIIVDTNENIQFFHEVFNVPKRKMTRIFVSTDEDLFFPLENSPVRKEILFYGTLQPLHGLDVILKAARLLENECDYKFVVIGEKRKITQKINQTGVNKLRNLIVLPPINYNDLPKKIAEAAICLGGPFGTTPKARRVITGKTFQFLSMGKPIIVGNTKANKELLTHGYNSHFCDLGNSDQLADSILKIINDSNYRNYISKNGLNTYKEKANFQYVKEEIKKTITTFT